tara:strand:+ start:44 stop:280 length:237 start_codon:yes stop_codon:yes gene_type:complete
MCGTEMDLHGPPEPPEIDWDLEGDELARAIKLNEDSPVRSTCTCPEGCFQEDFPLYFHHPMGGIDSAPGDSWSLSWVK